MSVEAIFSIEYFNFLGLAHADKNKNGAIDKNEEGIFNDFIKQFDMNNNKKLDIEDTKLYRISVGCTDAELNAAKEFEQFVEKYGSDRDKMTSEQKKTYDNIVQRCANSEKTEKSFIFIDLIEEALKYFMSLPSEETKRDVFKKYNLNNIDDKDYEKIMI